jgi:hypothetical protein
MEDAGGYAGQAVTATGIVFLNRDRLTGGVQSPWHQRIPRKTRPSGRVRG